MPGKHISRIDHPIELHELIEAAARKQRTSIAAWWREAAEEKLARDTGQ